MKRKEIKQIAVGDGTHDPEMTGLRGVGLTVVGRLDRPQARYLAEQLDHIVGKLRLIEWADSDFEHPFAGHSRCRCDACGRRYRCCDHRHCNRRRNRYGNRAVRKRADACDQFSAVDARVGAALTARQQVLEHIARFKQGVDHSAGDGQFAAAKAVEQGLHDMREIGHILKPEGRRAALDRMRAAKNRIQRLVIGVRFVGLEKQGLHAGEVLTGFFVKDAMELRQVEDIARGLAGLGITHRRFLLG